MDHVSPKSQWKRPLGTAVQLFYLLERRNAIDLCPSRSTRRDLGLPRETISSNADVSQRRRCRKNVVSKKKSTLPIISTCYLVRKGVDFPGQEGLREMLRARTIIASPIKRWTMFQTRFSKTIESSRASPTQTWWGFKFFNWITIYLKTGSVWNGNLSPVRNISPVSVQRFFFIFVALFLELLSNGNRQNPQRNAVTNGKSKLQFWCINGMPVHLKGLGIRVTSIKFSYWIRRSIELSAH